MPELLCYLYHEALAQHQSFCQPGRERPVIDNFLLRVVSPMYEVVSKRMGSKDERCTYDDINEFFWRRACLEIKPFDDPGHQGFALALASALRAWHKTHQETHSWLHLLSCFGDVFVLTFALVWLMVMIAHCASNTSSWVLVLARNTSVLVVIGVLELQREIGRLWAEAKLELRLLSTVTATRLLAHAVYVCTTNFLVYAALNEESCSYDADGNAIGTYGSTFSVCTCPAFTPTTGSGGYTPSCVEMKWWIIYWSVLGVRLLIWILWKQMVKGAIDSASAVILKTTTAQGLRNSPDAATHDAELLEDEASIVLDKIASASLIHLKPKMRIARMLERAVNFGLLLYRTSAVGSNALADRYYSRQLTRKWSSLLKFWVPALLVWFGLVYIMVAAPGVGALYQWRGALQQGYMTLGEALVLFTIWLFQGLMISLIMLDIVFQLGVMVAAVVQTLLPNTGIPFPGGVKTTLMEDLCLKWNTPEKKTGSYGLGAMLLQASEQLVEKCVAPEETNVHREHISIENIEVVSMTAEDEEDGEASEVDFEAPAEVEVEANVSEVIVNVTSSSSKDNGEEGDKEKDPRASWSSLSCGTRL